LGVLFQPGGFQPFYRQPVSGLTDRSVDFREVFGEEAYAAERDILSANSDQEMVARAERFLRERMPEQDEHVGLVGRIVDGIIADRGIVQVDDAVRKFLINKRTMQRLFKEYVGVSPKWVIQRSRIHEAALHVADGERHDWAKLAADLGYFDQAHFIKDFKKVIGCSPEEYAKQQSRN
jgi:AraC-like DNA-binding protein